MYERPGRPHLCLRYSKPEIAAELLALAGILLNASIIANRWTMLPEMAPYYDSYFTNKVWLLALLSILPIGLYVILTILSGRLERFFYPVTVTEKNAAPVYRLGRDMLLAIKLEIVLASIVVEWYFIQAGMGRYAGSPMIFAFIAVAIIVMAMTLAYFIWMMRSHSQN